MEEINMKELYLELNKKAYLEILKEPIPYFFIFNIFTLNSISDINWLSNTILISNYFGFGISFLKYIQKNVDYNDIRNYIRGTYEYKKTRELYKEYLNNIASLLKSLNIKDSLDFSLYINKLRETGFLSYDKKYNFKSFKYNEIYVPELLGARIASGTGVCRHNASLVKDLLLELEIPSVFLAVKVCGKHHPEYLRFVPFNKANHGVVGIIDESGKYIFDPTLNYFASSPLEYYGNNKYDNIISQIIDEEYLAFYYLCDFSKKFNYQNEYNLYRFNNTNYKNIDLKELDERKSRILDIFQSNDCKHENFYKRNKTLMKELSICDAKLSPYSDEKKPEWLLHK